MATFAGTLNTNKVFAAMYNQIFALQVFSTGISNLGGIYEARKIDGTLYGDTKLFVSTDVLESYEFDGTDTPGSYNLLTIKRPPAPKVNKVVIDKFRQIPVTIDDYFTKQAFSGEGAFSDFNGTVLSWLTKTKEVYEHTKFTTDIVVASLASATLLQTIALAAPASVAGYDLIRWRAQEFFRQLEDAIAELNEPSRSYNDNGFLRNYQLEDFDIVVPQGILSSVRKQDIPYLFSPDKKIDVKEIHWKYFGTVNESGDTLEGTNTTVRSLIETDYTVGEVTTHVFPGDLLPNLAEYAADETYTCSYASRPSMAAAFTGILVHKQDFPIMSAFSVGTSFFNARRLDQNNYLTFGHNDVAASHIGEFALLKVTTTVA